MKKKLIMSILMVSSISFANPVGESRVIEDTYKSYLEITGKSAEHLYKKLFRKPAKEKKGETSILIKKGIHYSCYKEVLKTRATYKCIARITTHDGDIFYTN